MLKKGWIDLSDLFKKIDFENAANAREKVKLIKYKVGKKSWAILIILTFVSLAFYVCMDVAINSINDKNIVFETLRDVAVVITSILGTNLLISVFIDVNNKNKTMDEFFVNDIISSPKFYNSLNSEEKLKILRALEFSEHCNEDSVLRLMYDSVQAKLSKYKNDQYYFEKYAYTVNCEDKGTYYEKEILREMIIKPYKESVIINDYKIAEMNCGVLDNGFEKLVINSVHINGKATSKYTIKNGHNDELLDTRNGYTEKALACLSEPLLVNKEGVKLIVNTTARCPKSDKVSTFRTTKPCKDFSVDYSTKSNKYKVTGHAFGFLESAPSYPNDNQKNSIKLGFEDWIFTDDGIVITMIPNNN